MEEKIYAKEAAYCDRQRIHIPFSHIFTSQIEETQNAEKMISA